MTAPLAKRGTLLFPFSLFLAFCPWYTFFRLDFPNSASDALPSSFPQLLRLYAGVSGSL